MDYFRWGLSADAASRVRGFVAPVVFSVEEPSGVLFYQPRAAKHAWPDGAFARVLVDRGPLFDVVCAGTDLMVSAKLRAFLESEVPGALRFFPVALRFETGDREGYAVMHCNHRHRVLRDSGDVDVAALAPVRAPIFLGLGRKAHMKQIFARDDLVEHLVDAGFSGLGFQHVTGRRRARRPGAPLPEVAMLAAWRASAAHEETAAELVDRVATHPDANASWRAVVAHCRREAGRDLWPGLDAIDIAADVGTFQETLRAPMDASPAPAAVNGLWFGLGDLEDGDHFIEVCGSDRFEEAERFSAAWAVHPAWSTEESLVLPAFAIDPSADERQRSAAGYLLPWAYAVIVIGQIARTPQGRALLRGKARERWIAVGWNSGDFAVLGKVDASGFVPDPG